MSHRIDKTNFPYDESLIKSESDTQGMWNARIKHLSETLNIDSSIISHHDHHKCHAYYGYMLSTKKDEPLLVYTMDGFGDGANGTVLLECQEKNLKKYQDHQIVI